MTRACFAPWHCARARAQPAEAWLLVALWAAGCCAGLCLAWSRWRAAAALLLTWVAFRQLAPRGWRLLAAMLYCVLRDCVAILWRTLVTTRMSVRPSAPLEGGGGGALLALPRAAEPQCHTALRLAALPPRKLRSLPCPVQPSLRPLSLAVRTGNVVVVRLLLELGGANAGARDSVRTS